jgi:Urease beta subunit
MIPGEIIARTGEIELNVDRATLQITVANTGDRPIQIGSWEIEMPPKECVSIFPLAPQSDSSQETRNKSN